ncbi:unnamed protein product [Phytophthora fragariaefolia]|uniref:Unnamed protein product n=1 Tax=Phytophthora fragariaefolia TaxID=1490495 RepID=A0A9W7CFY4_9STRA|nr:unnamed protein product [Phytophthora fragariaefolia]
MSACTWTKFHGDSYRDAKYVQDKLTHYCELVAAGSANSHTGAEGLLDWHKRFGLPYIWISDTGAHFKCEVMEELAERIKATHMLLFCGPTSAVIP